MENFLKSISIQAVLAVFVISICSAMLSFMHTSETLQARLIDIILVIVSFYFGASHGSARKNKMIEQKDETIQKLAEKK